MSEERPTTVAFFLGPVTLFGFGVAAMCGTGFVDDVAVGKLWGLGWWSLLLFPASIALLAAGVAVLGPLVALGRLLASARPGRGLERPLHLGRISRAPLVLLVAGWWLLASGIGAAIAARAAAVGPRSFASCLGAYDGYVALVAAGALGIVVFVPFYPGTGD